VADFLMNHPVTASHL